MKRITLVFLSFVLITPCMANIHINPDAVTEVVAKHFPKNQVECIREYNAQLKASNGAGIAASKLWNVCVAGGLDIKQPADKEKCRAFVNDLTRKGTVKFYAACGKDKSVSGAVCINDFTALTVNMQQAQGLAKLYARSKSDNTIQCRSKPRIESTTTTSVNPHAMGMSMTTNTPYLQCTSYNSNKFYEFRFNSVDGNIDATNHKNFKTGICKIFGSKLIQKDLYGYKWDICSDIKDETACNKIDNVVSAGNIGYIASWGPAGYKLGDRGYQITSTSLPYCILTESVTNGNDGTLLFERTAFGLDGRVFLNAGVQRKGSKEIKDQIRAYVENTMGKENVKSFSCEDNYHTVKLKGRSGKDDMLRCTVNDKTVEFFFDDLSESWGVYDKSGHEAMNCIAWGGTFTGKKCIGLDEKMCNTVRDANAQSCPECKSIKWNPDTETCDLPSSANATSLKRGLTYTAIVGGAVVGAVVTIGTLGAATAPTALILTGLAVETLGAGIELVAQVKIDAIADEFLIKSNQCKSASCAQSLIKDNFQHLADSQNDFSDAEISAIDSEMARLAGLIPDNSDFWADIALNSLSMEDNKSGMFDFEHWTPEQTWRAVGITLQLATVITSVGKWVATKTKNVVTKLSKSSNVLKNKTQKAVSIVEHASDQRALTAKQLELQQKLRIINPNTLKGDDLELYNLWKKYAPRNQSFESFKQMGNLQEIRNMSKGWRSWDEIERFNVIDAKINKFFAEHPGVLDEVAMTGDATKYPELVDLWAQLDNFDDIADLRAHKYGNYSTFDNTLTSVTRYDDNVTQQKIYKAYDEYSRTPRSQINQKKLYEQSIADAQIEYFNTKLSQQAIDEVAALRVEQIDDIINQSPKLQNLRARWYSLNDGEKLDFAQELSDQLLIKNGVDYENLPKVKNVYKKEGTRGEFYSVSQGDNVIETSWVELDLNQIDSFSDFMNTLSHEVGGHGVNALNPNAGIGSQMERVSGGLHGSSTKIYRLEPEETIAWRIGDAVGATYRPTNPIERDMVFINPLFEKGSRVIDAKTYRPVSYEKNKEGLLQLIQDFFDNKVALQYNYTEDIRENFSNISNMLGPDGLRIFKSDSGHYTIATDQVMKSMM